MELHVFNAIEVSQQQFFERQKWIFKNTGRFKQRPKKKFFIIKFVGV